MDACMFACVDKWVMHMRMGVCGYVCTSWLTV